MTKISQLSTQLLKNLNPRQKEFLEGRFGLKDGKRRTLQELGEKRGITRERVRQIEAEGIKIAAKDFKNSEGPEIIKIAKNHLAVLGGLRKEDLFVEDIKGLLKDNTTTGNHLKFVFEVAKEFIYNPEDEEYYAFWYLSKDSLKKADNFIQKAAKAFSARKEELVAQGKTDEVIAELVGASNLNDFVVLNYLSVSKKFAANVYGDLGLAHWEEINPKTSRAKAYLVLKKHGQPLHFTDLAQMINVKKFDSKKVYPQTIHNELIKDVRFVLVGRGMYGLKEQGYFPGTAKEVIRKILKEKGPLHPQDVVQLVSSQRFLKENTILLNLQNRKHFKKLSDGRYHVT